MAAITCTRVGSEGVSRGKGHPGSDGCLPGGTLAGHGPPKGGHYRKRSAWRRTRPQGPP